MKKIGNAGETIKRGTALFLALMMFGVLFPTGVSANLEESDGLIPTDGPELTETEPQWYIDESGNIYPMEGEEELNQEEQTEELIEEPTEQPHEEETFTYITGTAEDSAVFTAYGRFPEGSEMIVTQCDFGGELMRQTFPAERAEKISEYKAYDVSFTLNGEPYDPGMTLQFIVLPNMRSSSANLSVSAVSAYESFIAQNEEGVVLSAEQVEQMKADGEEGSISYISETFYNLFDVETELLGESRLSFWTDVYSPLAIYREGFDYEPAFYELRTDEASLLSDIIGSAELGLGLNDVAEQGIVYLGEPELVEMSLNGEDGDWELRAAGEFTGSQPLKLMFKNGGVLTVGLCCEGNEPEPPEDDSEKETIEDWAEMFADVGLTGSTAQDVVTIAMTQLDYEADEDGYTRFGGWYGDEYGAWDAMFCSFCMNFAGVDSELIPFAGNAAGWVDALKVKELYYEAGSGYDPKAGDLIFFGSDGEAAGHVGIVYENEPGQIVTIEGDSPERPGRVAHGFYLHDDARILGYGQMPGFSFTAFPMLLSALGSAPYAAGTVDLAPVSKDGVQAVSWPEEGTALFEYDMQHDTIGMFRMTYNPVGGANGTERTVLVVTWPEYGTMKTSCSADNATFIDTVIYPDSHTAIMAFRDGEITEQSIDFTIAPATLTNAQAIRWMDGGDMTTGYTAAEYQVEEGYTISASTTLAELQEHATVYATFAQAAVPKTYTEVSIRPTNAREISTTYPSYLHTFHLGSLTVPQMTNSSLSTLYFGYPYLDNPSFGLGNGELRWDIPTAHSNNNPLIEITNIRIYVPDRRLKLSYLASNANSPYCRDLESDNFDEEWNNWLIGERTCDGDEYYYYDITPPTGTRWFNNGSSSNFSRYIGMLPVFQLVSIEEPLDQDTLYTAPNTVISYRIVGNDEIQTYSQDGPQIKTWQQKNIIDPTNAYNPNRYRNNSDISRNDVVIGSSHYNENFSYINNSYYHDNGNVGLPHKEYLLNYTGPITEHYDFPYSIQPSKVFMVPGRGAIGNTTYSIQVNLSSITYITADGVLHNIPEAEINGFNSSTKSSCSFTLSGASADNRVVSLDINWNKLYKTYDMGDVYGPTTNVINNGNMSLSADPIYPGHMYSTSFDYIVAPDSMTEDESIENGMVQVRYDLQYGGESHTDSDYLWFRLRDEKCPLLRGKGNNPSSNNAKYLDERESVVGNVYLYIGTPGEYKDDLVNPVINLKMRFTTNSTNMPDSDALAFFTGKFTAMPKLSGWVCEYTTLNHPEGLSWTIPTVTDNTGLPVQIPLDEGDYFKTLSMHYDGIISFPHSSSTDTRTSYPLMNDITIRLLRKDPFTGIDIQTSSPYSQFNIFLFGYLLFENCSCNGHIHNDGIGQMMNSTTNSWNNSGDYPRQTCFCNRSASFSYYGVSEVFSNGIMSTQTNVSMPDKNISQGSSVSISYVPKISPNFRYDVSHSFLYNYKYVPKPSYSGNGPNATLPFDIRYSAYVELLDEDFEFDLDNTKFMGVSVKSGNVLSEVVSVPDGEGNIHRFLKLSFVDGYIQPYTMQSYYRSEGNYCSFTKYPGCVNVSMWDFSQYITNTMQIGLTALPGARVGDHYPIGKVYYDYSELLEKYDAPNITGNVYPDDPYSSENDYNMTNYTFSNAVPDIYGLTTSTTTETNKLFVSDFSEGSATAQKVIVGAYNSLGADAFPGIGGIYDISGRSVNFTEPETEQLSAMLNIMGSANNTVTDYVTIVKLPRQGKSLDYMDENGSTATATSDITLELRGAVNVRSKNGVADGGYSIVYTTDEDSTAASVFIPAESVEDWSAVTGFKVTAGSMEADGKIVLNLDLRTDKKNTLDILHGYIGGSFSYKVPNAGIVIDPDAPKLFKLCTWNYNNIIVTDGSKGLIFWDTYNENGTKSNNTSNDGKCETGIKDIPVSLYDADGVQIGDTVYTDASGNFELETYKSDAGQYIVIGEPTVSGVSVKLTKNSTQVFYKNQYDSDFDRNAEGTTHTLVLPELPSNGYNNISAGFVKLPSIAAEDISLLQGETLDLSAVMTYYLGMALPATSYNLTFEDAADETIADVAATTLVKSTTTSYNNSNPRTASGSTTVTGVTPGDTTVRIFTVTAAGDTVEKIVNIHVLEPLMTVTKAVAGITGCTTEFTFTAELVGGSFEAPEEGAPYTVDEDGKANFALADGESIEIPVGNYDVILTETGHDGFLVTYSEDEWSSPGWSQTITDASGRSILVTNTAGTVLPKTGGTGTEVFLAAGALLVLGSFAGLFTGRRKRKSD